MNSDDGVQGIPLKKRLGYLRRLQSEIQKNEGEILLALQKDVYKSSYEGYLTEIMPIYTELRSFQKHLRCWLKPQKIHSALTHFGSKATVVLEPLGTVLIYSPWNYPFQLAILPLIAAIGAGNKVVLSLSPSAPHTYNIIKMLVNKTFQQTDVIVLDNERFNSEEVLSARWDHIFYAGGEAYARTIAKHAGEHLIPLTLELGGKSPVILDKTYNLPLTCNRLAWAKLLNAGQTCVAPDYILLPKDQTEVFIPALIKALQKQLTEISTSSMLAIKRPERLELIEEAFKHSEVIYGGKIDKSEGKIQPTIVLNPPLDSLLLTDELFLPIFPIITYNNAREAIEYVNHHPKPLALYIYSNSKSFTEYILNNTTSGTVAINDSIMQISHPYLPFGGVGESGMGRYHGRSGVEQLSNHKSILRASNLFDIKLRYTLGGKLSSLRKLNSILNWFSKYK